MTAYILKPVGFGAVGLTAPTLPASFRYVLASAWLLTPDEVHEWLLGGLSLGSTAFQGIAFTAIGTGTQVQLGNNTAFGGHSSQIVAFTAPTLTHGAWQHWLWSMDTEAGTFQLYVNDTPISVIPDPLAPYVPMLVIPPEGVGFGATFSVIGGCQGDVYLNVLDRFYDLTVTANRRAFIDSNGDPVYLGANGSLPTGTVPQMFLTVGAGGAAADFLTNSGNGGGSWAAETTISFCSSPPPQPPPVSATIADLWFSHTPDFVDLTAESNRRNFISDLGGAPSLGTDGSAPFSVTPPAFLSAASGNPGQFAVNDGRGGVFTLTGTLVAGASNPLPVGSTTITPNPGSPGRGMLGDFRNGNLYAINPKNLTDNGTPRRWLRRWRGLTQFDEAAVRFSELTVDMQTGIGVPDAPSTQTGVVSTPPTMAQWTGPVLMAVPAGAGQANPFAASSDGSVLIVQTFTPSFALALGFVWNVAANTIVSIPPLAGDDTTQISGCSADGSIVVGTSSNATTFAIRAFRWTADGGTVDFSSGVMNEANCCSADGSVIFGRMLVDVSAPSVPCRWTAGTGAVPIGDQNFFVSVCTADGSEAFGSIIVEGGDPANLDHFATWTEATGVVDHGPPPGGNGILNFFSSGITPSGSLAVISSTASGAGSPRGFLWSPAGGYIAIPLTGATDATQSTAFGITSDGGTVAGSWTDTSVNVFAAIWTAADGWTALPSGFGTTTDARGISADGTLVWGDAFNSDGVQTAAVWRKGPPSPGSLSVPYPPSGPPYVMLRWSDDGGRTWSDTRIMGIGQRGATNTTVKFNRLGSTRRFRPNGRVFELSSDDPFLVAILGADVEGS